MSLVKGASLFSWYGPHRFRYPGRIADDRIKPLIPAWLLEQPAGHFDRRGHHEAVLHEGKFYLMSGKREDAIEKVAHHDIWVHDLDR